MDTNEISAGYARLKSGVKLSRWTAVTKRATRRLFRVTFSGHTLDDRRDLTATHSVRITHLASASPGLNMSTNTLRDSRVSEPSDFRTDVVLVLSKTVTKHPRAGWLFLPHGNSNISCRVELSIIREVHDFAIRI